MFCVIKNDCSIWWKVYSLNKWRYRYFPHISQKNVTIISYDNNTFYIIWTELIHKKRSCPLTITIAGSSPCFHSRGWFTHISPLTSHTHPCYQRNTHEHSWTKHEGQTVPVCVRVCVSKQTKTRTCLKKINNGENTLIMMGVLSLLF